MADFDTMLSELMADLDGDGVPDAVQQSGGPGTIDPRAPLPYVPGDPNAPQPYSLDNPEPASRGYFPIRYNEKVLFELPMTGRTIVESGLSNIGKGLATAGMVAGTTGGPAGAISGPLTRMGGMVRGVPNTLERYFAKSDTAPPARWSPSAETLANSAEWSRRLAQQRFDSTTQRMQSPLPALPKPERELSPAGTRNRNSYYQEQANRSANADRRRVAAERASTRAGERGAQSMANRQAMAQQSRDAEIDGVVSKLLGKVEKEQFESVLANEALPMYLSRAGLTMDDFVAAGQRLGYYTRPYAQSRIQGREGGRLQPMTAEERAFRDAMRQGRIPDDLNPVPSRPPLRIPEN